MIGQPEYFLFIETPNRQGVTTMNGLGNGLVQFDNTSEGVDGLDFLQNLSLPTSSQAWPRSSATSEPTPSHGTPPGRASPYA